MAVFGLNVSDSQTEMLSRISRRVVCFDSEPVAQRAAKKLAKNLLCFPGRTELVQLDSPDPGSATEEEVRKLRKMLEE